MNATDVRCQTALGRTLCKLLHGERPPVLERDATRESLRPSEGPHNAIECRVLAIATTCLAVLIAADLMRGLPVIWRVLLSIPAAPLLLQAIAIAGVAITGSLVRAGLLSELRRPVWLSRFLLACLTIYTAVVHTGPTWSRWVVATWLLLCLLELTCAACELLGARLGDSP